MKSHILILGFFLFICECTAQKVNISCAYNWANQASQYVNSTFCCTVNAPLKIDRENTEIERMQRSFTCFVADQKEIFFFPRGLQSYIDNLQVINITNSKLTEIKADDINTLQNLTVLDLSGNELTVLESSTFSYNQKLMCLNLNYNKIYYVAQYTFKRGPSVRYLDFQHNICDSRLLINHSEVQTGKEMIENECSLSKLEENILKKHEHQREQSVNRTRIEYESFKKEIVKLIGDVNKSVAEIVLPIIGSSMGDYLSNLFSQNDTDSGNAVNEGRALSTKKQILNELNGIVDKNLQNYLKSMEIDQHKQKIGNLEKRLNDTKNELDKKLGSNQLDSKLNPLKKEITEHVKEEMKKSKNELNKIISSLQTEMNSTMQITKKAFRTDIKNLQESVDKLEKSSKDIISKSANEINRIHAEIGKLHNKSNEISLNFEKRLNDSSQKYDKDLIDIKTMTSNINNTITVLLNAASIQQKSVSCDKSAYVLSIVTLAIVLIVGSVQVFFYYIKKLPTQQQKSPEYENIRKCSNIHAKQNAESIEPVYQEQTYANADGVIYQETGENIVSTSEHEEELYCEIGNNICKINETKSETLYAIVRKS